MVYIRVFNDINRNVLMKDENANKKNISQKEKLSSFERFTEIMGWIQIVASPLLLAAIIGFLVYISKPNTIRLIMGIVIVVVGLIIGIIWATKLWKRKGTMHFMSRVNASPELDPPDEEIK